MQGQNAARVTTVDGLRGLLALLVMLAHVRNDVGDPRFIGMAQICVMSFFAISGYVLTRGWRGRYLGFLARRALRLWPVYALCMGLGGWLSMNPPAWTIYFWFPFTLHSEDLPQDPAAWSLFVEVWAMPFMPLIVWLGRRPAFAMAGVAACLAAQFVVPALFYGAFFIVGSFLANREPAPSWLDSAPAQWLGRISYSLYLSHVIVFGVIKFHAPALFPYLSVPMALIVAHALSVAVEGPSIALSRLVGRFVERAPVWRPKLAAASA